MKTWNDLTKQEKDLVLNKIMNSITGKKPIKKSKNKQLNISNNSITVNKFRFSIN